ncbi:CoA-transferase subunit beta [Mumia sp. DW29H23]|uniref:CoA-transferase subunit beta n=1 Tax=Mumia sp. DW29H23 TaxID=3421241 RepID=UPI003D681BEB
MSGAAPPAGAPSTDYTVDELVVSRLAAELADDDQVLNGLSSFVPVCAIEMARRTHAPGLVWVAGGTGVSPSRPRLTASTFEWPLWDSALMYVDVATELWDWIADPRRFRTFFAGAAQLDAFGNANISVVGDYHHPRVRLSGTAGLADMSVLDKRIVYVVTDHNPRTLVERVDFRSGVGYLDGYGERARRGFGGGPALVVTNLAVFDFAPSSQRMRLRTVHEGHTVDEVLAATGFVPVIADVEVTPPPTVAQVALLRDEIDPEGYRRRGFPAG